MIRCNYDDFLSDYTGFDANSSLDLLLFLDYFEDRSNGFLHSTKIVNYITFSVKHRGIRQFNIETNIFKVVLTDN